MTRWRDPILCSGSMPRRRDAIAQLWVEVDPLYPDIVLPMQQLGTMGDPPGWRGGRGRLPPAQIRVCSRLPPSVIALSRMTG